MGAGVSKLEIGDQFPEREHYFGLENFGNSVLQALYYCIPFRGQLLEYYANYTNPGDAEENLLTSLADLFAQIALAKKKTGVISPKRFVYRGRKQNESFRSFMYQDAHEFLNFLLNDIVETLEIACSTTKDSPEEVSVSNGAVNHLVNGVQKEPLVIWVHRNFQNSSLTSCLKNFFSTETSNAEDKFFCDKCCRLHETQKRMKITKKRRLSHW